MPGNYPPHTIAWFGERLSSHTHSDAPAHDDARTLAALRGRFKAGDMRGRPALASFIEQCTDAHLRYEAIHLFCAVARHEDLAFLAARLATAGHEDVFQIVVCLPRTLSAEAIPLLLALHEEYAGTALEEIILSAIDSLFPFGYEGGSMALQDVAPHFTGFAKTLAPGAYHYQGLPAFAGDLCKQLITAAAQARHKQTALAQCEAPDLLSIWSGVRCPVEAGGDVDDQRFEALMVYVSALSSMSWTRGHKYFYGHDIAVQTPTQAFNLTQFTCAACAHVFTAADLHGPAYGSFLMRSQASGELRLLDASADPAFDEVASLMLEVPALRDLSEGKRARLLWALFGSLACDRDVLGMPFMIGAVPACPDCGATDMASWEESETGNTVEAVAPAPSHRAWSALGAAGKRQALAAALAACGHPV